MIFLPELRTVSATILLISASPRPATAQCALQWLPGNGVPGVAPQGNTVCEWDPDGPGPQATRLLISGNIRVAGPTTAFNLCSFDAVSGSWQSFPPLGSTTVGFPYVGLSSVAAMPNGNIVAGLVNYNPFNGSSSNGLYRLNGATWQLMASLGSSAVMAMIPLANGQMIVGGNFTNIGGVAANRIAQWNGATWLPVGSGLGDSVFAMVRMPNGDVVVGGMFTAAGAVPANGLARWNGSAWSGLASGVNGFATTLAVASNGDLVVGGRFTGAGGIPANHIARWDGAAWHALGTGASLPSNPSAVAVQGLAALGNGDIVATGLFTTMGGVTANNVARWDGTAWHALGTGFVPGPASFGGGEGAGGVVERANGDLVVAGNIAQAGGVPVSGVARWDGTSWHALSPGTNGSVSALTTMPDGDVVAGGLFTTIEGCAANRIARRTSTGWQPLGSGVNGSIHALTALANGDLVAGGDFTVAGGVAARAIARWNGSVWSPLGAGRGPEVWALAALPNGDLVAGGDFPQRVARWNGTAWLPLGSGMNDRVVALCTLLSGDVVAGGLFTQAGGTPALYAARWDGVAWHAMGALNGLVTALTTQANGTVLAGGSFAYSGATYVGPIAKWNGVSWQTVGGSLNGNANALVCLPNGDPVAGGNFGGNFGARCVRWNGSAWQAVGGGIDPSVHALTVVPSGEVVVGGNFLSAASNATSYLARSATPCLASSLPSGAGCPSSGGSNSLAGSALPWVGATFRARATGLPSLAAAIAITGFATVNIPLATLVPQGQPGCNQLVQLDLNQLLIASAGVAESSLAIPNLPAFAGLVFHHQMIPVEFDTALQIVAVTATNALTLTLGVF